MPGSELFGEEERKGVNEVLETGMLFRYNHDGIRNNIWKAKQLESELATYVGAKHAHFLSSGTAAVQAALAACGVGYGDEVIVPPYTFIATIEAVLYAGAIPVFAEIDETLCISPEGIKAVLTPKTKAVLLVHMCGAIGRLEEIMALCDEHNLKFIEDSAQALGAKYKGKYAGTFGLVGCYSFDYFKIITAGEGGALVTNDTQLYKNADTFSDHGHDHIGAMRGMENHPNLGLNYRAGELNAAIGLAQLRKIDYILERQKHNHKAIKEVLLKFPQISLRNIPDEEGDSCTFICFFGEDEVATRAIIKSFAEEGVDGIGYWYDNMYHFIKNWEHIREMKSLAKLPIHVLDSPQDYKNLDLPKSYNIVSRLISMTIKVTWTAEELADRCTRLEKALASVLVV